MNPAAIIILRRQDPTQMIAALRPHMPMVLSYDTPAREEWEYAERIASKTVKIARFDRSEPGFFAGANRNNGLKWAMLFFPNATHFFFFDGDRVPYDLNAEYINRLLYLYSADCCLFTCEAGDPRAIRRTNKPHGLVDAGCMSSDFYSCGFVISRDACKYIFAINNGNLFHPAFDGIWGEEDKFLGIQLDNAGYRTIFSAQPRLGGKPVTAAENVAGYEISLQRRIRLMQGYCYPLRPFDKYERLEYINGRPVAVYVGENAASNKK